jgi:putative RNA 2'-phosphotransferase
MNPKLDYKRLSKVLSYALRHKPENYNLTLDKEGWVDFEALSKELGDVSDYKRITQQDIEVILSISDKKRFELKDGKIRARYGHSVKTEVKLEKKEPPKFLYHATHPDSVKKIMKYGLRSMSRQKVHLTIDTQTAMSNGRRKSSKPKLLKIHSKLCYFGGNPFYYGDGNIWLADYIGPEYLEEV